MFCPKCGTKAIEGAGFCQKCGYKLKKDTESTQAPPEPEIVSPPKSVEKSATPMEQISEPSQDENAHRAAIPTPVDSTNIYALLKDNVNMCPAIRSVKQTKNGVILRSGIYKHFVTIVSNKARIGNTLVFPLSILYGLPCGLLCYMVSSITWDFMNYGSFYLEDFYGPLLALCLLIAGITVMIHTFCGNKGKSDVAAYVREIIEPHGFVADTKKSGKPVGSIAAIILILAGVIILIFPQLEDFEFGSSRDISSEVPNSPILPDDGNISLTQIFTSETEGFSFMYPAEWVATDDPAAIVQFASGSTLGIRAVLSVNKSDYDESAFYATKEELEVDMAASADGSMSDIEVTDLTDTTLCGHPARRAIWTCKNIDGIHFIVTNYYYSSNSCLYLVSFMVIEDHFSQYEPILDAIMESYIITSPSDPGTSTNEGGTAFPYEARMAYAGKVQELAAENGDLQFALIDLTDKDIPELVAESSGYFVKVFFYDDGEVVGGDTWAYGAAGNMGYEYLPGENVILNYNSDYAGDIQYESYFALGPAGELSPLPNDQLSIWYFRDANGNGYPDDDEPFLEEPLYYVGDSEVSKDVYASHQITGEFEWLSGDKSADEMMVLLGIDYEITYPNEGSSMGGNIITAPDIVTPPSDPGTSSAEYAKLVEFGDEGSWITLYQDGTFDMQVSLSDTYGTLSGTYEETDWGFACYVKEKSFSGYGSDDVEYFELVICDYGVEYRGDAVGTWADDGPVYQVVEP